MEKKIDFETLFWSHAIREVYDEKKKKIVPPSSAERFLDTMDRSKLYMKPIKAGEEITGYTVTEESDLLYTFYYTNYKK